MSAPQMDSPLTGGAWTSTWVHPHESAFCLLQKYLWANLVGLGALSRQVFSRGPTYATSGVRELLHGDWIDLERLHVPAGMPLMQGFTSHYSRKWMRWLTRHDHIRFCAVCLADGFHSVLHQIVGLAICPIHEKPFQITCLHCGSPTPALELAAVRRPFRCTHCEQALAGVLDPRRWIANEPTRRAIRREWQPIVGWLRRLNEIRFTENYREAPLGQLHDLDSDDVDEAACFHLARRLVPLKFPVRSLSSDMRPLQYRLVHVSPAPPATRTEVPVEVRANSLEFKLECLQYRLGRRPRYPRYSASEDGQSGRRRILRSIARYLRRRRLREHRRCLAAVGRRSQSILTLGQFDRIEQQRDACPVAAAYGRWRMQFFSAYLRKYARRPEDTNLFMAEGPDTDYSYWAHAVLAEFYGAAATALLFDRLAEGIRTGHPTSAELTWALTKYSHLPDYGEPYWSFAIPSEGGTRLQRLMVLGDQRILSRLKACAAVKCNAVAKTNTLPRTADRKHK